jgi:hypothetical protein
MYRNMDPYTWTEALFPPPLGNQEYVQKRWGKWFASRVKASGLSKYRIAKALKIRPTRINAWEAERRSVRADGAFNYGQRLMELGVPGTSGPIALHAAGHTIDLMLLLRRMSVLPDGNAHAVTLYCVLPDMHNWLLSDIERQWQAALLREALLQKKCVRKSRGRKTEKAAGVKDASINMPDVDGEARLKQGLSRSYGTGYFQTAPHPLDKYMKEKDATLYLYEKAWQQKDERRLDTKPLEFFGRERSLHFSWDTAAFAIDFAQARKAKYGYDFVGGDSWWVMLKWARWAHPKTLVSLYDSYLANYLHDPLIEARAAIKRQKL